jgi:rare lipoprotein A
MFFVCRTENSRAGAAARRSLFAAPSRRHTRAVTNLLAVVLAAAELAACAQSTVMSRRSDSYGASRQAASAHTRSAAVEHTGSLGTARTDTVALTSANGVASFYSQGGRTASGENFNAGELTAAHPTLPFGTRLRVTNVTTGQSVVVRVNDRGPYVPGRSVDVSYAAAQALGMVDKGVAKVKMDVVQ